MYIIFESVSATVKNKLNFIYSLKERSLRAHTNIKHTNNHMTRVEYPSALKVKSYFQFNQSTLKKVYKFTFFSIKLVNRKMHQTRSISYVPQNYCLSKFDELLVYTIFVGILYNYKLRKVGSSLILNNFGHFNFKSSVVDQIIFRFFFELTKY